MNMRMNTQIYLSVILVWLAVGSELIQGETTRVILRTSAESILRQLSMSDDEIVVDCDSIKKPDGTLHPRSHEALYLALECRQGAQILSRASNRVELRLSYMLYLMNSVKVEKSGLRFDSNWWATESSQQTGFGVHASPQPPVTPTFRPAEAFSPIQPQVLRSYISSIHKLRARDRARAMQLVTSWPSTGLSGNVPSFYGAPVNAALVHSVVGAPDLEYFLNRQLIRDGQLVEFDRLLRSDYPVPRGYRPSHSVTRIVYEQYGSSTGLLYPPYRMVEMDNGMDNGIVGLDRGAVVILNPVLRGLSSTRVSAGFLSCEGANSLFGSAILQEIMGYGWTAVCMSDLESSEFAFEVDRVVYRHSGRAKLVDYLRAPPFHDLQIHWSSALQGPIDIFLRLIDEVRASGLGSVSPNDLNLAALKSTTVVTVKTSEKVGVNGRAPADVVSERQLGFGQCSAMLSSMVQMTRGDSSAYSPISTAFTSLKGSTLPPPSSVPQMADIASVGHLLDGSKLLISLTSALVASRQILGIAVGHAQVTLSALRPSGHMLLILIAELQARLSYEFSHSMVAYSSSPLLSFIQCALGGECTVVCYPIDWIRDVENILSAQIPLLDKDGDMGMSISLTRDPINQGAPYRYSGPLPTDAEGHHSDTAFMTDEILYLARAFRGWWQMIPKPHMPSAQLVAPYLGRPTTIYSNTRRKEFLVGNPGIDTCVISFKFYSAGEICDPLAHKTYCAGESLDTAFMWLLIGIDDREWNTGVSFSMRDVHLIRPLLDTGRGKCGFNPAVPSNQVLGTAGIVEVALAGGALAIGLVVVSLFFARKIRPLAHSSPGTQLPYAQM